MSLENFGDPHDNSDSSKKLNLKDGTYNAEAAPGRGEEDRKEHHEKPNNPEADMIKMLALGRENANMYAENHSDAKAAIENPLQIAYTKKEMYDNWPA